MGDRDSEFTTFVAERRRGLLRTAYLLCGSWHQAEDVLQIALAKLYVAWPRVERGRGPEAYTRQIIARTAVDEWRRPWRREVVADGEAMALTPAREPDPTEAMALRAALAQLPARQRQVMVLRYWSGLSIAETAADLDISEGAVKSHAFRAMARLQILLGEPANTSMEGRNPR